jgi:hypothetical protein
MCYELCVPAKNDVISNLGFGILNLVPKLREGFEVKLMAFHLRLLYGFILF